MNAAPQVYTVYYDEELDGVVMDWEGYSRIDQFMEGSELMLNTLIRHNASKVLANIRDMVLIGKEEQDWLLNIFLPRAVNFGFRAVALVRPSFYFNNVAIESIADKMAGQMPELRIFESSKEARNWLTSI